MTPDADYDVSPDDEVPDPGLPGAQQSSFGSSASAVTPEQRLARAVLGRAFADALLPGDPHDAVTFLFNQDCALGEWGETAGLSIHEIAHQAARSLGWIQ